MPTKILRNGKNIKQTQTRNATSRQTPRLAGVKSATLKSTPPLVQQGAVGSENIGNQTGVAVNTGSADRSVYYNTYETVIEQKYVTNIEGTGGQVDVGTVAGSTFTPGVAAATKLGFDTADGFTVTNLGSGLAKISGGAGISGYSGQAGAFTASGYSGATGSSGYSGSAFVGSSGYSGAIGATGAAGSTGTSGFSGYSGASGRSGFSGSTGASGFSGQPGAASASGYSGASGRSGSTGPTGTSGFSGTSGRSGFSGPAGASGFSGTSGRSGFSGSAGASGFSGPAGASGFSGTSGRSGFSGSTGASGFSGQPGAASASGYSGSTGASGFSGSTGASGFSGYSGVGGPGTSGFSGTAGASGFSGIAGVASASGYSGSTGASGFSGLSGWSGSGGSGGATNFSVTNSGSSSYTINTLTNPTLNLIRGQTYIFNVSASGHPFWIKTAQVTGTGSAYSSGVTGNGSDSGTVTFVVPLDAPATLYYICQFHSSMGGTIAVSDGGVGDGLASTSLGFRVIPQNSQSTAYTLVASDSAKHILHPSADTTARTFTIPANSSVAWPVGTALTFINQNGAGTITISITGDTMRLAGTGTTGDRTLAANGVAMAIKIASTEWIISGTGLS